MARDPNDLVDGVDQQLRLRGGAGAGSGARFEARDEAANDDNDSKEHLKQDDQDAQEALDEQENENTTSQACTESTPNFDKALKSNLKEPRLVDWADDTAAQKYKRRYNVAPRCYSPVLRRDPNNQEHFILEGFQWGLVPHWSKEPPNGPQHTINATCEKLREGGGMWGSCRNKKRCVVVAEGFYEWQQKGNQKLAHFVRPKNGLMLMAGLWDHAEFNGEFPAVNTFTIITVPVSNQLRFLHNRMPAILESPQDVMTWLSSKPWCPEVSNCIKTYQHDLVYYQVPPEVGKVQNDDPSFIKPLKDKKGTIASMFAKQSSSRANAANTTATKAEVAKPPIKPSVELSSPVAASRADNEKKASTEETKPSLPATPKIKSSSPGHHGNGRKRKPEQDVEVLELDDDDDDAAGDKDEGKANHKSTTKKAIVVRKTRSKLNAASATTGKMMKKKPALETDDQGNATVTNFFKPETST
ncbi:hypothetical protein OIO90_005110 [Microbotryomycetes sp. JL221]|nr:hypothetical protein OIO90_005110 [Microbotryomycetes sp. JL221]